MRRSVDPGSFAAAAQKFRQHRSRIHRLVPICIKPDRSAQQPVIINPPLADLPPAIKYRPGLAIDGAFDHKRECRVLTNIDGVMPCLGKGWCAVRGGVLRCFRPFEQHICRLRRHPDAARCRRHHTELLQMDDEQFLPRGRPSIMPVSPRWHRGEQGGRRERER